MKKFIFAFLISISSASYANDLVTRCYPVAQNVNGELIVSQKCETHEIVEFKNFDGRNSYSSNSSAYGVALPDSQVVVSGVKGMALGTLYSKVPFSWVFVR